MTISSPARGTTYVTGRNYTRYIQTRTFGSLDGLRAIAILAVVWHHTCGTGSNWLLLTRGFLGVDLFFVISGFLIATLLLRERSQSGNISLRGFYFRRTIRILPPYFLTLFIVGAMAFVVPGSASAATWNDLPFAIRFIANLVPMR